jgi:hypothetical protein
MPNQFTNSIMEAIVLGWGNFVARPSGPLNFRFFIQPAIGSVMALRAALKDAREGRPAYLWGAFTNHALEAGLLVAGWKDIHTTFLISTILDAMYQVMVHRAIYLLERLFTATLLAVLPYFLLRCPVNRVTRWFSRPEHAARGRGADGNAPMCRVSETGKSSAPAEKK